MLLFICCFVYVLSSNHPLDLNMLKKMKSESELAILENALLNGIESEKLVKLLEETRKNQPKEDEEIMKKTHSFMETKMSMTERLTLKLKDLARLQGMNSGKNCENRIRFTINSKKCAKFYKHKDKVYRGTCVPAASPDSKEDPFGPAEYCYEEGNDSIETKNWERCKPDLNYCHVSKMNNQLKGIASAGIHKARKKLDKIKTDLVQLHNRFSKVNLDNQNNNNDGMNKLSTQRKMKEDLAECMQGKKPYLELEKQAVDKDNQIKKAQADKKKEKANKGGGRNGGGAGGSGGGEGGASGAAGGAGGAGGAAGGGGSGAVPGGNSSGAGGSAAGGVGSGGGAASGDGGGSADLNNGSNQSMGSGISGMSSSIKAPSAYISATQSMVPKQEKENYEKINIFMQAKEKSGTVDCAGMDVYSGDSTGTGVNTKFFKSKDFRGAPDEKVGENIDDDWSGSPPLQGYSKSSFSVKQEAYLKIPHTGKFTFHLESDSGSTLFLNNKLEVKNNFNPETQKPTIFKKLLDTMIPKMTQSSEEQKKSETSKSKPIFLKGGQFVKVLVTYYHTEVMTTKSEPPAFLRLLWESERIQKIIIPSQYYYREMNLSPAKPSCGDPTICQVRNSKDHDMAFVDSEQMIIKDLPDRLKGFPRIKYPKQYTQSEIKLDLNVDSTVYIASLSHMPPAVSESLCEKIDLQFVLAKTQKITKPTPKVKVKHESLMQVCQINGNAPVLKVPVNLVDMNSGGVTMTIFVAPRSGMVDNTGKVHMPSCSGKEIPLFSNYKNVYSGCTASSTLPGFSCYNGFDRSKNHFWKAYGRAIGEWVKITYKKKVMLTRAIINNSQNPAERSKTIIISYGNGMEEMIDLANEGMEQEFKLTGQMTDSVKFKIASVYSTSNNGMAIRLYGVECNDPEKFTPPTPTEASEMLKCGFDDFNMNMKPYFAPNDPKPQLKPFTCMDTLTNTYELQEAMGDEPVTLYCNSGCVNEKRAKVYGTGKYSSTSSICKAAMHSGVISAGGGFVNIRNEDNCTDFNESYINSIKSKFKKMSTACFSFETTKASDISPMSIQEGAKVDLLDPITKVDYIEGMITSVVNPGVSPAQVRVVSLDQGVKMPDTVITASAPQVMACGTKIKNRSCQPPSSGSPKDSSSPNENPELAGKLPSGKSLNSTQSKKFSVVFGRRDCTVEGANASVDKGLPLGLADGPYGWNTYMTDRILTKTRKIKMTKVIDSVVAFSPDPKSNYCTGDQVDPGCIDAFWSMIVTDGNYKVAVTVGHPDINQIVNLQINDKPIAEGVTVHAGETKIFSGEISTERYIRITTDCSNDCDKALVYVNKIDVIKIDGDPDAKPPGSPVPNKSMSPYKETEHNDSKCSGTSGVENCVYDLKNDHNPQSNSGRQACRGAYHLVYITQRSKFRMDAGKMKCVMKVYGKQSECDAYCPNPCKGKACN